MAKELLPDALWARIAPLHLPEPPKPLADGPSVGPGGADGDEHRAEIHLAFLQLGCALISLRFLG